MLSFLGVHYIVLDIKMHDFCLMKSRSNTTYLLHGELIATIIVINTLIFIVEQCFTVCWFSFLSHQSSQNLIMPKGFENVETCYVQSLCASTPMGHYGLRKSGGMRWPCGVYVPTQVCGIRFLHGSSMQISFPYVETSFRTMNPGLLEWGNHGLKPEKP